MTRTILAANITSRVRQLCIQANEQLPEDVHNCLMHARLQETWPELTETDLRHCAYIKMGTKTKDVAKVLHVTLRGVEAARYRIKRKLELSPVQSLDKFLREF